MFSKKMRGLRVLCALLTVLFVMVSYVPVHSEGFDWGQWLDPDESIDETLSEDEQLTEMERICQNDRFELFLQTENGVFCVKDTATGECFWSSPFDRNADELAAGQIKKILSAQLILNCYNRSISQMKQLNSYTDSVQEDGYSYEQTADGFTATYRFPVHEITVQLEVRLTANGLMVTVPMATFNDTEEMMVCSLGVLPYLMSSSTQDEGYLLVPDGSGAIIRFNNGKTETTPYYGKVYGENLTYSKGLSDANILLPVFGMQKNNSGMVAILENGAESAELQAMVSGQKTSYNNIYPTFTLRTQYTYDSGAYNQTAFDVYENREPTQSAYTIQYYILEKDKNDYADMAQIYRQYLLEQRVVSAETNYSVVLDVLGAVRKVKSVLGIPIMQSETLTQIEDLNTILDMFTERGITDIALRYTGATNSSLCGKLSKKLSIASSLGSRKELVQVAERYLAAGGKVYIEYNPVMHVRGLFSSTKLATKDMLGQIIKLREYSAIDKEKSDVKPKSLLKPTRLLEYTESLLNSVTSEALGYAPQVITQNRYIDYDSAVGGVEQTVSCFEESLQLLSASGGLLSNRASGYALPYSEMTVDLPHDSSRYDLFDGSVPFYEIVVSGILPHSYDSLNTFADCELAFLNCIETGAVPKYSLVYGDMSKLSESQGTSWYAGDMDTWVPYIVEQVQEYRSYREKIGNGHIVAHSDLSDEVSCTVFENGVTAIVNYGTQPAQYAGYTVAGRSYVVLGEDGAI